jgi:hypothetical protein
MTVMALFCALLSGVAFGQGLTHTFPKWRSYTSGKRLLIECLGWLVLYCMAEIFWQWALKM